MNSISWLLAANIAVWAGLGAYIAYLALAQRRLSLRLRHMEMLHHE